MMLKSLFECRVQGDAYSRAPIPGTSKLNFPFGEQEQVNDPRALRGGAPVLKKSICPVEENAALRTFCRKAIRILRQGTEKEACPKPGEAGVCGKALSAPVLSIP